jgi:hypothetical protein
MSKATALTTLFSVVLMTVPGLTQNLGTKLDGNELLRRCTAEVKTMDQEKPPSSMSDMVDVAFGAYCTGLVRGVDSTASDLAEPDNATLGQAIRVVLLYLQNHPEELHKPDHVLVHEALRKAFPAK